MARPWSFYIFLLLPLAGGQKPTQEQWESLKLTAFPDMVQLDRFNFRGWNVKDPQILRGSFSDVLSRILPSTLVDTNYWFTALNVSEIICKFYTLTSAPLKAQNVGNISSNICSRSADTDILANILQIFCQIGCF